MTLNELPRHLPGSPPSSMVFNRTADEVDALGLSLTVKRDDAMEYREGMLPANTNRVVQWHSAVSGTGTTTGGYAMWNPGQPQFVTIRQPGTYLVFLQVRFGIRYYISAGVSDNWAANITPGSRRFARVTLNGTSLVSDCIANSTRGAVTATTYGLTLQTMAAVALQRGDTLWSQVRAEQLTPCGDPDYGGTYLSVTRVGPAPWTDDEAAGVIRV